ncbi:hypothetical protein DL769_004020 [Monosporascus sp. CRB-8-3]|nr:hypothetical protein DL769_004020 [Monosporascus sp. CRB-8-3]
MGKLICRDDSFFLTTIPRSDVTLKVTAPGILLMTQRIEAESTIHTTIASSINPPSPTQNQGGAEEPVLPDRSGTETGAVIGGTIGGVLGLLALGFLLLRRYRRRQLARSAKEKSKEEHTQFGRDRPELEGSSGVRTYRQEAELDAPIRRAELEGTTGETGGAGLYVQKAELKGSPDVAGARGVYVLKKSELGDTGRRKTPEPGDTEIRQQRT